MFDQANFDKAERAYERQRMIDCENGWHSSEESEEEAAAREDYNDDDYE